MNEQAYANEPLRVLGILQARASSSRLPGKVLMPILGKPMLALQIEREHRSRMIDRLIVATSEEDSDDPIQELCQTLGVQCHRGSLRDVLDRFYGAARQSPTPWIVRLTGDCPLADPEVIDSTIEFCIKNDYDYASNSLEPTFPDGLDVEVFKFSALETAWQEATLPSDREHVTPFIHKNRSRFRVGCYKNDRDLSDLRWTVDEPEDFELIRRVYEALYPENPEFGYREVLALMNSNPELKELNSQYVRNEGYLRSLADDEATENP